MIQQDWPNLSADIRHEIETNTFSGHADVIIGQDNLWKLVLAGIVVHHSEDFGIWKTKLGWMIGGKIPAIQPRELQQEIVKIWTNTNWPNFFHLKFKQRNKNDFALTKERIINLEQSK